MGEHDGQPIFFGGVRVAKITVRQKRDPNNWAAVGSKQIIVVAEASRRACAAAIAVGQW